MASSSTSGIQGRSNPPPGQQPQPVGAAGALQQQAGAAAASISIQVKPASPQRHQADGQALLDAPGSVLRSPSPSGTRRWSSAEKPAETPKGSIKLSPRRSSSCAEQEDASPSQAFAPSSASGAKAGDARSAQAAASGNAEDAEQEFDVMGYPVPKSRLAAPVARGASPDADAQRPATASPKDGALAGVKRAAGGALGPAIDDKPGKSVKTHANASPGSSPHGRRKSDANARSTSDAKSPHAPGTQTRTPPERGYSTRSSMPQLKIHEVAASTASTSSTSSTSSEPPALPGDSARSPSSPQKPYAAPARLRPGHLAPSDSPRRSISPRRQSPEQRERYKNPFFNKEDAPQLETALDLLNELSTSAAGDDAPQAGVKVRDDVLALLDELEQQALKSPLSPRRQADEQ
jgi:hypothetical protein